MKKNCNILFAFLILLLPVSLLGQDVDAHRLQTRVQNCIKKVRETSVCLYEFDTVANRIIGPQFSGVVVSSDGMILTAAHACEPSKIYLVTFPSGKQLIGKGLGSIQPIDAAALKIIKPGVYPYAKMGRSSLLQVNQPCVSIAYPGSFSSKMAVVRFGYVADVLDAEREMIRTTCLMEPGDSGGPVFDLEGAVIGIRSSIDKSLESNFEVPIDLFRKYWSALSVPLDYVKLPQQDKLPSESGIEKESFPKSIILASELTWLKKKLNEYTVQLINTADSTKVLGTMVLIKGFGSNQNEKSYLISKSSLLKDKVLAVDQDGQKISVKVIYRDERQDLALLCMNRKANRGIDIKQLSSDTLIKSQLGKFLFSPRPPGSGEISVLGTLETNLKETLNTGYLGAGAELQSGRNVISYVQDKSPAKLAGVQAGDEIISVNGVKLPTPDLFVDEVQKNKAHDVISMVLNRNNRELNLEIKLGVRPLVTSSHVAERFEGGKSQRRDGFSHVFVHDGKLKPFECGGPIFSLDGNFMGINIARYSRTSVCAISTVGVKLFLKQAIDSPVVQAELKKSSF